MLPYFPNGLRCKQISNLILDTTLFTIQIDKFSNEIWIKAMAIYLDSINNANVQPFDAFVHIYYIAVRFNHWQIALYVCVCLCVVCKSIYPLSKVRSSNHIQLSSF